MAGLPAIVPLPENAPEMGNVHIAGLWSGSLPEVPSQQGLRRIAAGTRASLSIYPTLNRHEEVSQWGPTLRGSPIM